MVNSHYQQAHPDFYGVGIHRATLCHILENKCREYPELIIVKLIYYSYIILKKFKIIHLLSCIGFIMI